MSQPRTMPHAINVMHNDAVQTHLIPCDLASLSVGQLYKQTAAAFGVSPDAFELMHMSNVLVNDDSVKAIDIGLSNNMFLIMQPRGAPYQAPPSFETSPVPHIPHPAAHQAQHAHMPHAPQMHPQMHPHQMPMHMCMSPQMPAAHSASPYMMPPQVPHHMPMPMSTSPQMMPNVMGMSPQMQPVSPMSDPYLEQCDLALAQTLSSQMQLNAVMHNFSASPMTSSPTNVLPPTSMPVPVSPPAMRETSTQRMMRPTGSVNLNSTDLCAYATTNEGSRATVVAIEETESAPALISAKIAELATKFGMVASNQHGSKVVRALLKKADAEQATVLLQTACSFTDELCESNTGSDVFVEVINACRDSDAPLIVTAILNSGPAIAKSINGRKVIVAVLSRWTESTPQAVEPIFDMIGHNLVDLAQDQTGCVTIQRCLDNAKDIKLKTQLQLQIMNAAPFLFQDMYGNYVLQHAIKGQEYYGGMLAAKLEGKVASLATNKYSSCVIEKVLIVVSDKVKESIITEVLDNLKTMMWDGFGNFVVQSAVDYAPASMLDLLKEKITPFISDCPYGYRIEGKLNKRVKKTGGRRSVPHQRAAAPSQERSVSPEMQVLSMIINGAAGSAVVPEQQHIEQLLQRATQAQQAAQQPAPIVPAP